MLRLYLLAKGDKKADYVPLISQRLIESSRSYFPEGYEMMLEKLRDMPLFELTENIISFFGLGDYSWNVAYLNTFQDYIVSFTGSKYSDTESFLEWWETRGIKKSVVLPGNQDAMRILTIHKSKGLEFKVVILPFLSWSIDHIQSKQPILWVKPPVAPFNELGILPVKYSSGLADTIFADYYKDEKCSVHIDNINLLYVAFTRARDAVYGFVPDNLSPEKSIAGVIKKAVAQTNQPDESSSLNLSSYYQTESRLFEFGEIPENRKDHIENNVLLFQKYSVSSKMDSLKLKLHGENYFSSEKSEVRKKINYGNLMHEVFEGINTSADIPSAVKRLVMEGKLPEEESADLEKRIFSLISSPQVSEWFMPGNEVMTEAGILMPSGNLRRPDRIIFKDGRTSIIDFKFGSENSRYIEQVNQYRNLLYDMGYSDIDTFIWYVDNNKIIAG
jgi:ATP-dependent exoDNAse (exonuclease V) beta subunit